MANQEQLERLLQGVKEWNQWRQENPDIIPDLGGANLSGANLSGANLSSANLSGAVFSGANLSSATLIRANLEGANLYGATLIRANFYGANLYSATLIRANLSGANLYSANCEGASFEGANLHSAYLIRASFEGANLEGANLIGANFEGANFEGANLIRTNLEGARLIRTNLYIAYLEGDDLIGANLDSADPPPTLPIGRSPQAPPIWHTDSIPDEPDSTSAFCYVHAEMDERVVVNRPTSVEVVLSKEQLGHVTSKASQGGTVKLESDQRLIVQVIPKTNFVSEGDDRVEVDPPEKGNPCTLYFDLRATHLGEGEVWVVLRQTQQALLTLILRPHTVENRTALRVAAPMQLMSAPPGAFSEASGAQRIRATESVTNLPTPSASLHQLRIIERRNGNQITYLYELNSPLLEVLSLHESKPIHSDRLEYVENLYKEIESRWASTQGEKDDFAAELRAFGGQLFDQLFPDALKQQLWEHREQLDNIMVLSTEPFVPWELVHLKPPGQNYLPDETWFLGQMGLVRWLHNVGFPPETLQIRAGKARYVIPHYPERYRLPQAEQEAQWLEEHFGATALEAQPTQVRAHLSGSNFDLLHFAGHGLADQDTIAHAKLMLEGRVENGQYIQAHLSATTVEQYCNCNGRDRNKRPMVVLNACQIGREGYCLTGIGGFAQAFLKGGVGVFVGTLWSVGDRPARLFTETLYSSLLEGKTLSESTTAARHAAQQAGDSTWLAYVVYGHPHLKLRSVSD